MKRIAVFIIALSLCTGCSAQKSTVPVPAFEQVTRTGLDFADAALNTATQFYVDQVSACADFTPTKRIPTCRFSSLERLTAYQTALRTANNEFRALVQIVAVWKANPTQANLDALQAQQKKVSALLAEVKQ